MKIKNIFGYLFNSSLYKNSIFLMMSSAVMSFFGFFFWLINARLYTTEQIGLATAMISVTTLINSLGGLGLSTGIVRYLPLHKDKNSFINTVFILTGLASFLIALFYILFIDNFSPKLSFINQNFLFSFFFIGFIALSAINMISDSIFIAYKSSKYIFIYNIFYGFTRLLLPFFLISLGTLGIFWAHSFGVIICLILTIYFLIKKFEYKISLDFNTKIIKEIGKFSFGSYIANFVGGLPALLFPIIILHKLGASVSAFYYMDMMIISFLYMIPIAISQSLFAESSHEEKKLKEYIIKSLRINLFLLLPAILLILLFGKYVLLFFGKEYVEGGLGFLWLMALSSLTVPINYTYGVYLKIYKKVSYITLVATLGAIITMFVASFSLSLGIYAAGVGIIAGQISQIIMNAVYVWSHNRTVSIKP